MSWFYPMQEKIYSTNWKKWNNILVNKNSLLQFHRLSLKRIDEQKCQNHGDYLVQVAEFPVKHRIFYKSLNFRLSYLTKNPKQACFPQNETKLKKSYATTEETYKS